MSTTPAFSSPALTKMFGPVVGNFLSSFLEFLYEQCSLHITEKIPSSVMFGSRPRIFWMRAYSSFVTPCSAATSGVTLISMLAVAIIPLYFVDLSFCTFFLCRSLCSSHQRRRHRLKNYQSIRRIQR